MTGVAAKQLLGGVHVVPRHRQRVLRRSGGHSGRSRNAEGGRAAAGAHEQAVRMSMVAAVYFDNLGSTGESAGQAQRAHGCLGPGRDAADPLERWDCLAQKLGKAHLALGRRPKSGSTVSCLEDRGEHLGMRMAQDERSPGTDVVDVEVAIDVPDVGAQAPLKKKRGSHRRRQRRARAS